ncbi:ZP2 protein, partial [Spelaeornis formosus]|nr:ZP2 protein [Elachura formosa]
WLGGLKGMYLQEVAGVHGPLPSVENVTCHRDGMEVEFHRELSNYFWHVHVVDVSGEDIVSCDHNVDFERLILRVLFVNCTSLQHGQHQLWLRVIVNDTMGEEINITYSTHCEHIHLDEVITPVFATETNCTKDFMAVTFPGLISSLSDEHMIPATPMSWNLSVDDGTRTYHMSLGQAVQQGYNFLVDDHNLVFQVAFAATGVVSYKHDDKVLYTLALKLVYGPPEHRQTVESRMLCAPGPAICNATYMTVAIPAFPGILMYVNVENKIMDLLQENGITLDTQRGVRLYISRRYLKSRLLGESCSGLQYYMPSLKLTFRFYGETVAMLMHPECPCEQHTPIAAVCTRDGYMDFEILAESTTPLLDLDTLRLRDPLCRPAYKSPLNDRVWFHVPLNACGTRHWVSMWLGLVGVDSGIDNALTYAVTYLQFDGEKIHYENEVTALWTDLPLGRISRDSDLRLTVMCSFSSGEASLTIQVDDLSPLPTSVNQGSLSLVLLSYPEDLYRQPYREDQYPIVRYLRQPIFLEVQVLNRNDPNLHLVLDDCWATASQDPRSLPQWNIVVDGCEYDLDGYRTVFHPVGRGVSYANYRQRLEVKTFAFVSGGKVLPGLVYFHCSVLICHRFHPDSPLCIPRCPRPSRSKRESGMAAVNSAVVSLGGPVVLVPEKWSAARGRTLLSKEAWAGIAMTAVGVLALATVLLFLAFFKCLKTRAYMVNVVH